MEIMFYKILEVLLWIVLTCGGMGFIIFIIFKWFKEDDF